jgi:8-oxo-dGTP pyrophosphatase MutT (NUDIX family)
MAYALFQVSLKAVIWRDDEILVLRSPDGAFDCPGGRIDEDEKTIPRTEVLSRELLEELGPKTTYVIGNSLFTSYRTYDLEGVVHDVMVVFYETVYSGGNIELSEEHSSYEWVTPVKLLENPSIFKSSDEFEQFRLYFDSKLN